MGKKINKNINYISLYLKDINYHIYYTISLFKGLRDSRVFFFVIENWKYVGVFYIYITRL